MDTKSHSKRLVLGTHTATAPPATSILSHGFELPVRLLLVAVVIRRRPLNVPCVCVLRISFASTAV